jgi:hypothetical protein
MNMSGNATVSPIAGAERSTLRELLKIADGMPDPVGVETSVDPWLYERYVDDSQGWKRRLYYALKPVIPRPIQIALRQRYVSVQAETTFPAWPVEPLLVTKVDAYLRGLLQDRAEVPRIAYWPGNARAAFVITHDVEMDAGLRRAPALAALEKELGFTSCWNLVPERYPIDWGIVDELRKGGSEIGVHGLKHDGKLFQSRSLFSQRLRAIHEYARSWGAEGFRSPSTLRNAEWMTAMQFAYDSSFPDTDPYEPQTGGCCSIWPYFIGPMVELPLTLAQDHALFEILQHRDIGVWKEKMEWLLLHGGVAMLNVHPDYMLTDDRLGLYRDMLVYIRSLQGVWHVQPREAARWWRDRQASNLQGEGGTLRIVGPAADRGVILRCSLREGAVVTTPAGAV